MLNSFIMNAVDTFNITYLWVILSRKDNNIIKLLLNVCLIAGICTIIEKLGLNFIIITYGLSIIIIKMIYRSSLKDVIFGFLLIVLIDIILQLVIILFIDKFIIDDETELFFAELIIMILIIIFSKIKSLNKYAASKYASFEKINSNILIYFILSCSVYVVVFKFVWNNYNYLIQDNLFVSVGIIIILILCQFFTYLYIVEEVREEEKLKLSDEYNHVIDEIVQEIKQRQHDFVNYKNTIKGIVDVVDKKDVKSSISKYINNEDVYDDKINSLIYIDNVVIRSIIYRNMCKFKKNNIDFEYEIENNVFDNILSYNELSNVLSNLLNNAFEEVIKDDCLKKNIKIKIIHENEIAHLIVSNQVVDSKNININEIFTRGYSTKNSNTRGYGLHNIQSIINSHKGCIKINIEGGEIIFDIYFNVS